MRILFATDGSPCSEAALNVLCTRPWPPDTEVKVVSVVQPNFPLVPDPFLLGAAFYSDALQRERIQVVKRVSEVEQAIHERAPDLRVTTEVLDDLPKKSIVEESERWHSDLILLGSHGYGPVKRFLLGSVSLAVALHAPCSVEIVRP